MKVKSLSRVRLLATPWTAAYQAPLFKDTTSEYNKKETDSQNGEQTGGYQGEGGTNCYVQISYIEVLYSKKNIANIL